MPISSNDLISYALDTGGRASPKSIIGFSTSGLEWFLSCTIQVCCCKWLSLIRVVGLFNGFSSLEISMLGLGGWELTISSLLRTICKHPFSTSFLMQFSSYKYFLVCSMLVYVPLFFNGKIKLEVQEGTSTSGRFGK